MADQQTYAEWLKANPAPNFAALIACHGGYEAIPPQAWTAFADAQIRYGKTCAEIGDDRYFLCNV
jgi:hypothetical protein